MPKIGDVARAKDIGQKDECKYIYIACPGCGAERWIRKGYFERGKTKGFCMKCIQKMLVRSHTGRMTNPRVGGKREMHPAWKGGRFKSLGYIHIRLKEDDFFYPMAVAGCVREHRLVMARSLNRCLLPWEVVHHKNGIKDDNRLENLQLLPGSTPHLVDTTIKRYVKKLEKIILNQHEVIKWLSGITL